MMTRHRFLSALALTIATALAVPIHAAPVQVAPGAPVNYKMFPRLNATAGPGCTAQTVNWTNGANSCSGTTAPTVNQATAVVTSSSANAGIGNFQCDGSTNSYTFVAAGSTCAPPAPTTCSAATVSWTVGTPAITCSGAAGTTAVGSSTSVNSTNANSGSGNFSCGASGTFNYVAAGSTCTAPAPAACTSQTVNWNQGGSACSVTSGTRPNGSTVTMNSTNGNNGSAQVTCNSVTNSYSVASGATCFPNACTSQNISWTVSNRTCSAPSGTTTHSTARTVSSTSGNTGSATVTCNAQTNTYSTPTGTTCNAPAATACTSQTVNWTQGANTCSGSTGTVNNSASQSITTNTSGRIGSATVTCNGASNTYTVSGGTCAPSACTSQTINWSQGGNACTAPSGTTNNGVSKAISSTNTNQGSVTVACNSTTNTYTASGATCAPPAPTSCATGTVNWTVGGVTCSGTATQTNVGTSRTVSNATSGRTGSATFPCTTAGTFGSPTSATCANIPPANCAAGNVTWTASNQTCSGSRPAMNSGTTTDVLNTAANRTGTASYSCANGTVTQTAGSCSAAALLNANTIFQCSPTSSACMLVSPKNGRLYNWGTYPGNGSTNSNGILVEVSNQSLPILSATPVVSFDANTALGCFIDSVGLKCFGNNVPIGDGTSSRPSPVLVNIPSRPVKASIQLQSAGCGRSVCPEYSVIVLNDIGEVYAWGVRRWIDGRSGNYLLPTRIAMPGAVTDIATSGIMYLSNGKQVAGWCGIVSGVPYCMGFRFEENQQTPQSLTLPAGVLATKFFDNSTGAPRNSGLCFYTSNSRVMCTGTTYYRGDGSSPPGVCTTQNSSASTYVSNLNSPISFAKGTTGGCALVAGGDALCWGTNTQGFVGLRNVNQTCGRDGNNHTAIPTLKINRPDAVKLTIGGTTTFLLLSDGTILRWGRGSNNIVTETLFDSAIR